MAKNLSQLSFLLCEELRESCEWVFHNITILTHTTIATTLTIRFYLTLNSQHGLTLIHHTSTISERSTPAFVLQPYNIAPAQGNHNTHR